MSLFRNLAAGRVQEFLSIMKPAEVQAILRDALAQLTDQQLTDLAQSVSDEIDKRWPRQ